LELVADERSFDVLQPALRVLATRPEPAHRIVLVERYQFFDEDGPRRDQGCFVRAAILGVLRHLARQDDLPLLEQAARTYEFMPPRRSEVGAALRASALLALADLDDELAAYHAVSLLLDPHPSRMSGEPAVTSARVLAAQGVTLPLFQYIHLPSDTALPDVTA
jgi:hypothetical protein